MAGRKDRSRASRDFSKEALLDYVRNQPDRAAGFRRILDDFEAGPADRRQIKEALDQLVKEEKLVRHRGARYAAPAEAALHIGRISIHRDGYGFVTPGEAIPGVAGDVFIPPSAMGSAMDGDTVGIVIASKTKAEGRVVRVAERARRTIVGQLRYDGRVYFVSPADDKLPDRILVDGDVSEHKDKIVEIELTRFPAADHWPAGKIVAVIGFIDDPEVETTVIIRKFGLAAAFPAEVEEEAGRLGVGFTARDLEAREDFRDRETITIDPATARDFDDAVDVRELPGGGFELGVHVADVAHYVPLDSATDKEARARGCSVYFPDRVLPMLPERLSNDVCSLNPRTDCLALSVLLQVDSEGRIVHRTFHESVIRSRERMNYGQVQQILEGDAGARKRHHAIVKTIETLEQAARLLRQRRIERGTIDFDLPEPELTYDEQGLVQGIVKAPRFFSHRMIEEFMIAANEAVALLLETEIRATLFRVHEPPDPARVGELAEALSELGLRFNPRQTTPLAFQQLLSSLAGRPDEQMISFIVLRSFRQAIYSIENRGHFGLASPSYTHFTSPIRRYPDLVVHRLLKAYLSGQRSAGYTMGELAAIAEDSSRRERIADEAERDLFDWKRMILLERRLGDTLEAVVISVFANGIRVELVDYFIEGYVAVDDMADDYYDFHARARALVGRGTRRRYRLGQRIAVRVARIDKLLGRAYFLPVLAQGRKAD